MAEIINEQAPELDLNEILRVRREKLDTLIKDGKNPFTVSSIKCRS